MHRRLSPIEQIMWIVDQVARQNFVMVSRLSKRIPESVLRQALDIIQDKFPPLKWKIKEEGEIPEFVTDGVPKIPLRIIKQKNEGHWIEETEKELDEPFPFKKGPLVRAVLLDSENQNKCDLLVTFCHVPTDGISSIMVIKNLLTVIAKLNRGEDINPGTPLDAPLPTLEILRDDLEFPPEESAANKSPYPVVELAPDTNVPVEKRRTRIIQKIFTETETSRLVTRCKEKNTSVHGVLCAAFFQAVIEQIRKFQNVPKVGPLSIGSYSPVNIRHLFKNYKEEDIGYYIGIAVHSQPIDEKASIWTEAVKVINSLKEEIKYGRHLSILSDVAKVLKNVSTPLQLARDLNNGNAPLVTTNLGRVDIPEEFGDFELEEFYFPGAIHFDAKCGLAIDVGTFRNRLHITFLYAEPYILQERANSIVESTMTRLMAALTK
jgi:hypothetical protein